MTSPHFVWVLGLLALIPGVGSAQVTVAAAANFTAAMERLQPIFEQDSGHRLRVSFGSTGKLYAQIRNGAPFDVFLAADQRRPELLEQEGLAVAASRRTYASGRLALWSADPTLVDDEGAVLASGRFQRLAIANPRTAPYGAAAIEVLRALGVFEEIEPRLVRGENIAQTFAFVSTRNAQLGFIALSQARALAQGEGSIWVVPGHLYAPIRQDAVLLKRAADNAAARAFLDFLAGDVARAVILELGYGVD
jgi:molybdate transport system substrate-binding protein